jgi:hypothetical protein
MKYLYEPVYITVGVSEDVKCFRYEQTSAEESVLLTTRSSDFITTESATTEMTTTNDVITEIPTLQTDDTERITLIGDNTFISTQESSAMIETTSPTLRNTKMDDNTFLSTTKSGTSNRTTFPIVEGTVEEITVSRTTYSTTISPVGKSSSSSSTFSFLNDQSTMNTITEQHTNDVDIISNPQYTTSGGTVIHLSQNHNESHNQGK